MWERPLKYNHKNSQGHIERMQEKSGYRYTIKFPKYNV